MTRVDRLAVALAAPTLTLAGWLAVSEAMTGDEAFLLAGGAIAYAYFSLREVELVEFGGVTKQAPGSMYVDAAHLVGIPLAILLPPGIVMTWYFAEMLMLCFVPIHRSATPAKVRLVHALIATSIGSLALGAVAFVSGSISESHPTFSGAVVAVCVGVVLHALVWAIGITVWFAALGRSADAAALGYPWVMGPLVAGGSSLLVVAYEPAQPERILLALLVVAVMHESVRQFLVVATRLKKREVELESALDHLLAVRDQEREELAVALHEGPLQNVLVAKMRAEQLRDRHADELAAEEVAAMLDSSVDEIREVMRGRLPVPVQLSAFPDAISAECRHVFNGTGPELQIDVGVVQVSPEVRDVLLHVAREAVRNVAKHAGASQCWVSAIEVDGAIRLSVSDDGVGFEEANANGSSPRGHVGLMVMRRRVESIGGDLSIESAPSRGTVVKATVPT